MTKSGDSTEDRSEKRARSRGPYARGNARKEQLLQGLLRLVAREGLGAVSHRSVANEAGIPTGSVSYYFPKRIDLVRGAFSYLARKQLARIESIELDGLREPDLEVLADFAIDTILVELRHDAVASATAEFELILAISRDPDLAPEYREFRERVAAIQERVAFWVGSATPERDGRLVQAFLRGVQLEALAVPSEERRSREQLRHDMLHLLRALRCAARDH